MKKVSNHEPFKWYPALMAMIPVISNRSQFKIKVRLYLNYVLQALVLISATISHYFGVSFGGSYIQEIFIALRLILYILLYKININDRAIVSKIIIILQEFTVAQKNFIAAESVLLCVHVLFAFMLALSCEQRRGKFDERLGIEIPFLKEVLVTLCPFLVHSIPNLFSSVYYPTLIFAIIHSCLCYFDSIYNFNVKKILLGISLFNLATISIITCIQLTRLNRESIIIIGSIFYAILITWLINRREFTEFKILEQNPNSFSEWDYRDYFEKLIYLVKRQDLQGNQQILRGFYKHHNNICFSAECPLRYCHRIESEGKEENPYYELELDIILKYLETYLKGQLEIATIKYPNLKRFYIFYTSPSLDALRYCDKDNSFVEYRQAERIQQMYKLKDIEFQREKNQVVFRQVQHYIEAYIETSNYFWRLLYDGNIDFKRLEELGIKMIHIKQRIVVYEKQSSTDVIVLKLIKDFKSYLLDQRVGEIRLDSENQVNNKLYNFIEIQTKDSPIIIISAEPDTLEKIENINASCCRLMGYTKKEMLEKKLNDILPEFTWAFHTKLMEQRSKILLYESEKKLQTLAYVVTRSGYVFETALSILQLNSMKGRRWSCILTPTNQPNIIVLTDGEGIIQGLTANAYNIGFDLTLVGKPLCPSIFEQLLNNDDREWRTTQDHFNHLMNKEDYIFKLHENESRFRLRTVVALINPTKFLVFEIEVKKPQSESQQRSNRSMRSKMSINEEDNAIVSQEWSFNFPNIYSNINYHSAVNIKLKEQKRYEFVNFGEGISEMRYLNGQIQYKEDKSESSFEKEPAESSLIQIIDFTMKKETYMDLRASNKKKIPKPLIEFSIWIVLLGSAIVGIAIYNLIVFYLETKAFNTHTAVLAELDILKFQYTSITHSALELVYVGQGIWDGANDVTLGNITNKLSNLAQISLSLNQNETYINTFYLNYNISATTSLYDMISEFKLQVNNLLNSPTSSISLLSTSPVYQLMNISVNYLSNGFNILSDNLLETYTATLSTTLNTFIILTCCLAGFILVIFARMYFIVHEMNQDKKKLLSIYLEIEESIIETILSKNLSFKSLLQHNKPLDHDEQVEEDTQFEQEADGSERKRIKQISKYGYFFYCFLFFITCLGIFTVNLQIEQSFVKTMELNMQQIVNFGKAHIGQQQMYTLMNFIPISTSPQINNQTLTDHALRKLSQMYKTQMDFRRLILKMFNLDINSKNYSNFLSQFWFNDACDFISYESCETDFYRVLAQGADKFWMEYSNTMLILGYSIPPYPYSPYLYMVIASYLQILQNATKYYAEQILTIHHTRLVDQISNQIHTFYNNKIYLFSVTVGITVLGLIVYFVICLSRMKQRVLTLQEIVCFIPYKKLCHIIAFKKFIRRKYQQIQ